MKIYTVVESIDGLLTPYSYYFKEHAKFAIENLVNEYCAIVGISLRDYIDDNTIADLDFNKNRVWLEDGSKLVSWELFEHEIYEEE